MNFCEECCVYFLHTGHHDTSRHKTNTAAGARLAQSSSGSSIPALETDDYSMHLTGSESPPPPLPFDDYGGDEEHGALVVPVNERGGDDGGGSSTFGVDRDKDYAPLDDAACLVEPQQGMVCLLSRCVSPGALEEVRKRLSLPEETRIPRQVTGRKLYSMFLNTLPGPEKKAAKKWGKLPDEKKKDYNSMSATVVDVEWDYYTVHEHERGPADERCRLKTKVQEEKRGKREEQEQESERKGEEESGK
jgi:hypothetical protein